jgi:ABC-type taurine transport system substrate-binding protein
MITNECKALETQVWAIITLGAAVIKLYSREIDAKIFWLMQDLHDSEGLLVHNRYHFDGPESPMNTRCGEYDKVNCIMEPNDLRGKRVGVWWESSQHYSLTRFLEQLRIPFENLGDHYYGAQPKDRVPKHWEVGSYAFRICSISSKP